MSERLFKIKKVELLILESSPPQLLIKADGLVSSSGWTNPKLVSVDIDPADGIYEYAFVADPPSGISLQVITNISASVQLREVPQDLKGVVVHSANNSIEVKEASDPDSGTGNVSISDMNIIEPLLGACIYQDRLTFRVRSRGCTKKSTSV